MQILMFTLSLIFSNPSRAETKYQVVETAELAQAKGLAPIKFSIQKKQDGEFAFEKVIVKSAKAGVFELSDLQDDTFFETNLLKDNLIKSSFLLLVKGGAKDSGLFMLLRGFDFAGSGRELKVIHLNLEDLSKSKIVFQSDDIGYIVRLEDYQKNGHMALILEPGARGNRTVYTLRDDHFFENGELTKKLRLEYPVKKN